MAATVPEPHRQRPGPGTVAIPRPDSRPPPRPLGAASPLPLRSRLPPPPPPGPWPGISPAPPRRPDGGPMEAEMLCGLRAGWGRRRAADAGPGPRALGREPEAEAGGGAGTLAGGGWDETGGRLWGQIASRGEAAEWDSERRRGPPGSAMAAQCDPLSGYLQQPLSDPGSNSERSTDSPVPGSEEDSAGPPRPLHSPEWGEERFRVDRKKLEAMLQGKGGERRRGGAGRRQPRPGWREERGPRPGPPGLSGPRSRLSSCQCPGVVGDGAAAWRSRPGVVRGRHRRAVSHGSGAESRDRPCPGWAVLRLPQGRLEALRCRAEPAPASRAEPLPSTAGAVRRRLPHRGERAAGPPLRRVRALGKRFQPNVDPGSVLRARRFLGTPPKASA